MCYCICDETAVCIAESDKTEKNPLILAKVKILGDSLISQVNQHAEYGGVYPTLAVREHKKNLCPVLFEALKSAKMFEEKNNETKLGSVEEYLSREKELLVDFKNKITKIKPPSIDAIAVTCGPGLEPALWVGINFARALSCYWDIPLFAVDHMKGHIVSALFSDGILSAPPFPLLSILLSGGHTEFVYSKEKNFYEIIGETRDDALGEAYDKVGRMLGLPFPGGYEVACCAQQARKENTPGVVFPIPMSKNESLDLSFSGLKTAVKRHIEELKGSTPTKTQINQISRGFEDAAIKSVINKVKKAMEQFNVSSVVLGGGVSANEFLKEELKKVLKKDMAFGDTKKNLFLPKKELSTDNAVMIALAHIWEENPVSVDLDSISANSTLSLDPKLNV